MLHVAELVRQVRAVGRPSFRAHSVGDCLDNYGRLVANDNLQEYYYLVWFQDHSPEFSELMVWNIRPGGRDSMFLYVHQIRNRYRILARGDMMLQRLGRAGVGGGHNYAMVEVD